MGDYLNPGSKNFIYSLNSKIYVDKTDLIRCTNAYLGTQQRYMCVSRPRRFGKTMGLDMLAAYYSAGTDSHGLFRDLKISRDPSYEQHINRYDVIRINIQEFVSMASSVEDFLSLLSKYMVADLTEAYEVTVKFHDRDNLIQTLKDTANATGRQFGTEVGVNPVSSNSVTDIVRLYHGQTPGGVKSLQRDLVAGCLVVGAYRVMAHNHYP